MPIYYLTDIGFIGPQLRNKCAHYGRSKYNIFNPNIRNNNYPNVYVYKNNEIPLTFLQKGIGNIFETQNTINIAYHKKFQLYNNG